MKPLLLLVLCLALMGGVAYPDSKESSSTAIKGELPPPELSSSGALPSPAVKAPTPNSTLFYAIPVVGFWLILRRRTRGMRF